LSLVERKEQQLQQITGALQLGQSLALGKTSRPQFQQNAKQVPIGRPGFKPTILAPMQVKRTNRLDQKCWSFSRAELSTDGAIDGGMRRRTKAVMGGISVAAFLLFFFLAPVMLWFSIGPGYATSHPQFIPVYRSAGCVVFGYGDVYSQFLAANGYTFGIGLGCQIPIPLPR